MRTLPGSLRGPRGLARPPGIPTVDWSHPINGRQFLGRWVPGATLYELGGRAGVLTTGGNPATTPTALGYGYQFNGTTQYIQAHTSNLLGGAFVTASFWVNLSAVPVGEGACMAQRTQDASNYSWFVEMFNNAPRFQINGAPSALTCATSLTIGVWYHICAVFDGTTMMVYINGVKDANTVAFSGFIINQGNYMTWASLGPNGAGRFTNGMIDNMALFALPFTAVEVGQLYKDPWAGLIFPEDRIASQLKNGLPKGGGCGTTMALMGVGCAIGSAIQRNGVANRRAFLRGQWR